MSNLDKRKAELREYIEAGKKIAEGPYSVERVDFENDEITYEVSTPGKGFHVVFRESDSLDEGISSKHQSEFYALTANESARIAEELLIAIEALEKAKQEYWNKCYSGSGNVKSLTVNQFDKMIDEALNKIAGEK